MGFTQLFTGVLTIVGTLGFMLSISWKITLVVVLLTPLSLLVAKFIAGHTYSMFQLQSKARGEQTALINEQLSGQRVVQAFSHEDESLRQFDEINDRLTAGKHTVISTNLTSDEIQRRYSPQIASRLLGAYQPLLFYGKDIRTDDEDE